VMENGRGSKFVEFNDCSWSPKADGEESEGASWMIFGGGGGGKKLSGTSWSRLRVDMMFGEGRGLL
jgi:hypothetical protein